MTSRITLQSWWSAAFHNPTVQAQRVMTSAAFKCWCSSRRPTAVVILAGARRIGDGGCPHVRIDRRIGNTRWVTFFAFRAPSPFCTWRAFDVTSFSQQKPSQTSPELPDTTEWSVSRMGLSRVKREVSTGGNWWNSLNIFTSYLDAVRACLV